MKKIPIDRIEFWRVTQAIVSQKKYLVRRLVKAERNRHKRRALASLWSRLFDILAEAPYKKEWPEMMAHSLQATMTVSHIQSILTQPRKPEMMEGGVVFNPSKLVGESEIELHYPKITKEQQTKLFEAIKSNKITINIKEKHHE